MSDGDRGERSPTVGSAFALLVAVVLVSFIVGTLAFSQGKEWERRNNHPPAYAESAKEAASSACVGSDPAAVFECVYGEVEASQEQARAEQDLDAQQGMKFWAAIMAVLAGATAVITLIGVWYVKRTLETNQGFLEESRDATRAMVRANEIAANSQRPWIAIEPELIDFAYTNERVVTFDWRIRFRNIGSMVAENFHPAVKCIPMTHDFLGPMKEWFDQYEAEDHLQETVIIPGQESEWIGQSNFAVSHLPWETRKGYRKDCYILVLAMCRYRLPEELKWRFSMRGFSIGQDISHIDDRTIIFDDLGSLFVDNLTIKPLGRSRAT